ncbi:hypothetical protein GWN26_08940 [Candidatus Saccharibacteria bacterium]|nr:hypothetical protein [Candidatus Saccharibacteria bacterium]NIW79550.1 hypothetical protein [Calditrichia bacterium]
MNIEYQTLVRFKINNTAKDIKEEIKKELEKYIKKYDEIKSNDFDCLYEKIDKIMRDCGTDVVYDIISIQGYEVAELNIR